MSHDSHLGFIIAAYVFAFVIAAGMVVTIVVDYLNLKRALASFSVPEIRQDDDPQNPIRHDDLETRP
jgi:hypothetical protein